MKKFALKSTIAACALVAASSAFAADLPPAPAPGFIEPVPLFVPSWYARVDAGVGFFDGQGGGEAFTVGGGIGYRWSEMFRTDITVDYTGEYDLRGGVDAEAYSIMANAYADFALGSWLKPYVGAGIGYGDVEFDGPRSDDDGLAYAGYAGLLFDMTQNVSLDLGYRYRAIDISGPNFEDHSIRAGVLFGF